jgi:hypothetical protein
MLALLGSQVTLVAGSIKCPDLLVFTLEAAEALSIGSVASFNLGTAGQWGAAQVPVISMRKVMNNNM